MHDALPSAYTCRNCGAQFESERDCEVAVTGMTVLVSLAYMETTWIAASVASMIYTAVK